MILTFLFIIAAVSVGFASGMGFMAVYYKTLIKELRVENRQLRSSNRMLKRSKKDTIEIIYPKQEKEVKFGGF